MLRIERKYYLEQLIKKKHNGRIKIITGARRCGKSYLLFVLFKEYLLKQGVLEKQIIEINLDEIENVLYRNPFELNEYIKSKLQKDIQNYIFIDKIQLCKAVPNPYYKNGDKISFVDALLGIMKLSNVDIYVTGSNSKMLSTEVLTEFRDRGDRVHLYPLSFEEFCSVYEDKNLAYIEYITYGGMPYILQLSDYKEKEKYLKELFSEMYIRDILDRNNLKNEKQILDILLDFISSSIGSLTNPLKLSNRFLSEKNISISHNTISKYLEYFEESYIVYKVKRYDVKGAKYFTTPNKYYFFDIGLRNARLNFRQIEKTHIMENIIYNELIKRGYSVDVGVVEINENNTKKQLEIDFVVNYFDKKYYIQSAFSVEDFKKNEQEIKSLKNTNDFFKKIVITNDDIISRYNEFGIYYLNLKDFLLGAPL